MKNVIAPTRQQINPAILKSIEGFNSVALDLRQVVATANLNVQQAVADIDGDHLLQQGFCKLFPVNDGEYLLQLLFVEEGKSSFAAEVTLIEFLPQYFTQFSTEQLKLVLPFKFDFTHTHQFLPCHKTLDLLQQLYQLDANHLMPALQCTAIAALLLHRCIELITVPFSSCIVPACRFLNADSEKLKILNAQKFLDENIGNPITIKELSRKVAMNECYLKKGFKTIVGKTIFEYQHDNRIAAATRLLQEEHRSVSEVALLMGFSSIAHFSTAFKKTTGLKPCELLK